MTRRELPREEWPRLAGTELETVWPVLGPDAVVLVVEDAAGAIVGCWAEYLVRHVDGVWVHPAHRQRGVVARHLWRGMGEVLRRVGATGAWTTAIGPEIAALLAARATPVPGTHHLLSWKETA